MASINGITVKGIKNFRGHEGEPLCQGNVYLGNKKIGFWSQDSWGGPDSIYLDEPYRVRKLEAKVRELNREKEEHHTRPDGSRYTLEYSLDIMFGDLMELKNDEDTFKSAIKKGFAGVLLITDGYHIFGWNLSNAEVNLADDDLLKRFAKHIEDGKKKYKFFKEDNHTKYETRIYRSLDDFKIGKAIKLDDIK